MRRTTWAPASAPAGCSSTGLAALQDHLGKGTRTEYNEDFPQSKDVLPDTLKIDRKGTTLADVRALDYSPGLKEDEGGGGKSAGQLERSLTRLRNAHRRLGEAIRGRERYLDRHNGNTKTDEKLADMRETLDSMAESGQKLAVMVAEKEGRERLATSVESTGRKRPTRSATSPCWATTSSRSRSAWMAPRWPRAMHPTTTS